MLVNTGGDALNIRYLAGVEIVGPAVLFWRSGRALLIVSPVEYSAIVDRLSQCSKPGPRTAMRLPRTRLDVVTPEAIGCTGSEDFDEGTWALAVSLREGIPHVGVSAECPLCVVRALEEQGLATTICHHDFQRLRARKDSAEVAHIRQAQQSAVIAMRTAISLISETTIESDGKLTHGGKPLRADRVRREIGRVLLAHDCVGGSSVVCGVPGTSPEGTLRAHQPITIDVFPKHLESGYWGDLARTVVRGTAPPRIRKLYSAVEAAHVAALAKLKPGVRGTTIHRAAARTMTQRGFPLREEGGRRQGFVHSIGHGIGLGLHEAPALTDPATRVCAGHVLTVEPSLSYPDVGDIRLEDTVVIAAGGWRYLVPCERRLEV